MSLLKQFIQEYDDLYDKNLSKEGTGDILQEIKQAEKIINMPKLHPTQEIKQCYKQLKEQYKSPLTMQLVGDCHLSMIAFLNVLFKDSLIPLNNSLAQKKFIIRFSQVLFARAYYKQNSVNVNLHTLDCSSSNLESIEYFEVFVNVDLLQECVIIKESDFSSKKTLNAIKDSDCILWVLNKPEKLKKEELLKIIKKKPSIAIIAYDKKEKEEHEILEQVSTHRKQLISQYNLQSIHDLHLWNLLEFYRLDEKFALCKILNNLAKQQLSGKIKTAENILSALDQTKILIESFYAQKDTLKQDSAQNTIMQDILENIQAVLQRAKLKRGNAILKIALEKNKNIDKHYKIIFQHYKKLDLAYHKASKHFITRLNKLINDYNYEIFVSIAKGLKRYLDSIVESVLDNLETIKIKTRPNQPKFLDILTNRRIVYESFQLNKDELLREIKDSKSLLARKHKNLLQKLMRLDSYIKQSMRDIMQNFERVLQEWVEESHHIILQKKPSYISTDSYINLEEFQLKIFQDFTQQYKAMIDDSLLKMHTDITTISVWVEATKTILLECLILRIDQKFHADKALVKQDNKIRTTPLDKAFLQDCILEFLPEKVEQIFCSLPISNTIFDSIPKQLSQITKENEKTIRNKIREIMDLRQTLKNGTKILENAIENGSETIE